MPKVLLIQSTQYSAISGKPCKQKRLYLPGLAFPLLAGYLPPGWTMEVNLEVVDEINFDTDAGIVGIGAMGYAIFRARDIAAEFKKRGKIVFMGGYMPSILPGFVDDYCDGVIIGDAELSLPLLLQDFENTGTIKRRYDNPLSDLKGMPVPKYEMFSRQKTGFMLPVQAGRGCPHLCSYCSIACVYKGKYLARPVKDVMNDINRIKELGYRYFYLLDDNIVSNPDFLRELCARIKPLKMKWASQCSLNLARNTDLLHTVASSGCKILSLGIESLSQEGLDKLKKTWVITKDHKKLLERISKAGILPATEMMIGTDNDTPDSIRETYRFVRDMQIPIPKFYILTPMPGSELYQQFRKENRLLHEDYSKYTATNCVFKPAKMTPDELDRLFWWLYRKVYTIPNIIYRTLLNRHFFKNPLLYFYAFIVNLTYRRFIKNGDGPNIF